MAGASAQRVSTGLIALYDFSAPTGATVSDRSGITPLVDLHIADSKNVRRSEGALEVSAPTIIRSQGPATKLSQAIKRSGAITIEAWIRPANLKQSWAGEDRLDVERPEQPELHPRPRWRQGRGAAAHGQDRRQRRPSLLAPNRSLKTEPAHVVYTRDRQGRARIYVDGKKLSEKEVAGATSNWDGSMSFALANEFSGDRPWLGTYYLVAIYDRALSAKEVSANASAGSAAPAVPELVVRDPNEELFETRIAAILADRCLECHDPTNRKGKLDLSHRASALAGGAKGARSSRATPARACCGNRSRPTRCPRTAHH